MKRYPALEKPHTPDADALLANLCRKGTPKRVHHMELFHDPEIMVEICGRYDLLKGLDPNDKWFEQRKIIALRRFLGMEYVSAGLLDIAMPLNWTRTEDTAGLRRANGRAFMEEHKGPITTWEDFEKYPWPDMSKASTALLEWLNKDLPDGMCIASHTGHFAENLCWLMGYESLCYALYDTRDLVQAIYDKVLAQHTAELRLILQFPRVKMIWGSDDMGFKTGLLISPADTRKFVLPGHKALAKMAHDAGRPYLLHACGKLTDIREDLIEDVKVDGKHSFEDTIEDVRDAKRAYGHRMSLIGGIDVDFICRSDDKAIRKRVRDTVAVCQPGGGWALGTGNSVANYIPVDHYLAMVDEGWRCSV